MEQNFTGSVGDSYTEHSLVKVLWNGLQGYAALVIFRLDPLQLCRTISRPSLLAWPNRTIPSTGNSLLYQLVSSVIARIEEKRTPVNV